jgi:hypothetical protein
MSSLLSNKFDTIELTPEFAETIPFSTHRKVLVTTSVDSESGIYKKIFCLINISKKFVALISP